MTIRVLLVDDQELLRTAISSLIDEEDDLEVVGEAADGRDAGGGSSSGVCRRMWS